MISFCFLLAVCLASASHRPANINYYVERGFDILNKYSSHQGIGYQKIGKGELGNASFTDGFITGFDSIQRTSNCFKYEKGEGVTYEVHYGLRLALFASGNLKIGGEDMSAYARVYDNSIKLVISIHNKTEENCEATVDDWTYERLSNVEFGSSKKEYDGMNVDDYFAGQVQPLLQNRLDAIRPNVKSMLQVICKRNVRDEDQIVVENIALIALFAY